MRISEALKPKLILAFAWVIAFLIIWPFGEFPINDDWAYTKNVYNLAVNHKLIIDPWPWANVFSQTLYGSAFVSCFGFSFTLLRLSVFLLAVCSSFRLFDIFFRLSDNRPVSLFLVITIFFSPLWCALSFTFMTDIFFLSFLVFALYRLLRFVDTGKYLHYILFVVFCLVAVLNRQQALIFPVVTCGIIFYMPGNRIKKTVLCLLPLLLCYLANDKFRHSLLAYRIGHGIQDFSHFKAHLMQADPQVFFTQAGDLFMVMGWALLPVVVLLLLNEKRLPVKNIFLLLLAGTVVLPFVYKAWATYPLGNVSNILSIGPKNLKASEHYILYPCPSWLIMPVKIIGLLSAILGLYFLLRPSGSKNMIAASPVRYLPFVFFLLVYFGFVAVGKAYFDRYSIPIVFICLVLLVPRFSITSRLSTYILVPLALIVFAFGVLETRDSMMWHKTRWKAAAYLHNQEITPHQVDGGFEYNGWYKPIEQWSSPPKSFWWVDRDDYLITTGPQKGYAVKKVFFYRKFIPYTTDTIFVLEKNR